MQKRSAWTAFLKGMGKCTLRGQRTIFLRNPNVDWKGEPGMKVRASNERASGGWVPFKIQVFSLISGCYHLSTSWDETRRAKVEHNFLHMHMLVILNQMVHDELVIHFKPENICRMRALPSPELSLLFVPIDQRRTEWYLLGAPRLWFGRTVVELLFLARAFKQKLMLVMTTSRVIYLRMASIMRCSSPDLILQHEPFCACCQCLFGHA